MGGGAKNTPKHGMASLTIARATVRVNARRLHAVACNTKRAVQNGRPGGADRMGSTLAVWVGVGLGVAV